MPGAMTAHLRGAFVGLVVAGLVATGCTSEQRADISEAAVRNVVAVGAAKEFKDSGFPIRDDLTCTAKASRENELDVLVACTGTTTSGQSARLSGATDESLDRGNFIGTVDGKQVFEKTCLGC
jgi:hypothetical protein